MDAELHELSAGYALDALEPAERDAFEAHLASCPQCQQDLAAFWEVTGALAVAADARARARVCAIASSPTRAPRSRRSCRSTPGGGCRRCSPTITAIAAAVAIGLGLYALPQQRPRRHASGTYGAAERRRAGRPERPRWRWSPAPAGWSSRDGDAVLVLIDLPAAPAGKTYQAWVVEGQTAVSAGTFAPTEGRRSCRSRSPCRTARSRRHGRARPAEPPLRRCQRSPPPIRLTRHRHRRDGRRRHGVAPIRHVQLFG